MTDLSAGNLLSPIERARFSAELLQVREQLSAGTLNPIDQVRASARGLELRAMLGAPVATPEAAPPADPLLTELEAAKAEVAQYERLINAGAMTPKVLAALDRDMAARTAIADREKAQAIEAALLRPIGVANNKPHIISAVDALTPAGAIKSSAKDSKADSAIWYYQGDIQRLAFTASVTINGEKDPGADRAAAMVERLQAAKAQGYVRRSYRAGSLGTVWVLATADGKGFLTRAGFDELANPIFARPDMPESAPGYENMVAQQTALATAFISWLDTLSYEHRHNQAVVSRKIGTTPIGQWVRMEKDLLGLTLKYLGADRKTGVRIVGTDFDDLIVKAREIAVMPEVVEAPQTGMTEKGNPIIDEAVLLDVGLLYHWGEQWKYKYSAEAASYFTAPSKTDAIERASDTYATAKPGTVLTRAERDAKADAEEAEQMRRQYGHLALQELRNLYERMGGDIVSLQAAGKNELSGDGRRTSAAVANEGARETATERMRLGRYIVIREAEEAATPPVPVPAAEPHQPITEESAAPVPTQQPEIIEYTTKREKVLRGIIRTDLSLAEAKAIDPYTWKMNGGYFIREKYLSEETAHIPAAAAPVVLSAEQQAERQATAERQVEERRQQALASQVQKLRTVADKAVSSGEAGMNADRNTNTARRAGMAASAIEKASQDKAAGDTLNNIADAIEVGAAGMLANLTSRAQLDQLQSSMRLAQYETDKHLTYGEQQSRKGRPFDENDIKNLSFPQPVTWSNRYKNAALTIAKKAPTGNSRLIAALTKIGGGPERITLNDDTAAITRKAAAVLKTVGESWDLKDPMESLARAERLARMGVTNTVTLQEAVRELLPHLAERVQEDPVKKAERAIIGQKVGIDFFPTPAHVAQRMARMAHITKDTRVLEPSAGNGNLADAAKADGGVVDVIEISSQLRDILTAKGYNVVATDFDAFTPDQPYEAILMNPPFSKRQDAAHIMRAYTMLAGGGRLVAIAGEGVFFGQDQKAVEFREWLGTHGAEVETLEGGTFKDNSLLAQTSANARLIVISK